VVIFLKNKLAQILCFVSQRIRARVTVANCISSNLIKFTLSICLYAVAGGCLRRGRFHAESGPLGLTRMPKTELD
jgi:hypothetical protein